MPMFYEKAASKIGGPNRQKIYNTFKWIGAGIFLVTGVLIAIFNYMGKIQMDQMEPYSQTIRMTVFNVAKYFQNPIVDLGVFLAVLLIFYKLLKTAKHD
jgi:hypothetical protein